MTGINLSSPVCRCFR